MKLQTEDFNLLERRRSCYCCVYAEHLEEREGREGIITARKSAETQPTNLEIARIINSQGLMPVEQYPRQQIPFCAMVVGGYVLYVVGVDS